ncbi:MAG: dihydroneopterin triphosphate diphosphatase [Betaproteobacteria bacterium]|nr:dihydroneopterin triphosphate diphosphatase [Betaproteobacteria bacterium]
MTNPARTWKRPVSVLVLVHTRQLDVLLLERASHPGYWQSVTGSQEDHEDLRATAVRELAEETGILARAETLVNWRLANRFEIFPEWRHRYGPGVTQNTEHVFSLMLPGQAPVRVAAEEHLASVWLPWQEAAARVFSWTNRDAIFMLAARSSRLP